ncbi:hypothetical protein SEPCBS57363_000013 [Sporothrix epigloea]|uniref:Uncharacterized protein n=1 Tax=Sporothrix epigloea TaxID=1892477 RepID=A0ABP0D5N8_9PEZI
MAIRDHGFYAYAFVVARPFQIIALGALVGMTGNFINQDSHAHFAAPSTVVGTLVVSSIALFWTVLSITAYDDSHIPYWATAALDLLFAVPFVVGAAVLGGPLGGFSCSVLPTARTSDLLAIQTKAATATSPAAYILFVGDSQTTCYQVMAIWGLALALCALFAVTGLATCLLYFGWRRLAVRAAPKTIAMLNSRPVVRGPSPMMPIYRSEPGSIEMASATSKWLGSDEYDDDRHDRNSPRAESSSGQRHDSLDDNPTFGGARILHGAQPQPASPADDVHSAIIHQQRIQTVRRRPHRVGDGEDREEDSDGRGEEDDDDDDEHSDDGIFGGGLTTPLSPPPQTHQTMYGLGGSNSTPNSGRASAASSRFNTPRTPLSPVFPGRLSPSPSTGRLSNSSFIGGDGDGDNDKGSSHSIHFSSPRSSSSFPPPSSRPIKSCSTPVGSSRLFGPCAPPAPSAALSQLVMTPIAGTASDTISTPTPLLRELTPKHTSALFAKYTPSNPLKRNLPASLSSLTPPLLPSGRAILWPLAYPLSPVRRQLDLSPISPILPPRPQPTASRLDQLQDQRQQLLTHRKTLLQRIEGWWDLGLLRGGTVKGRGRPLAAINAVSAMASPRSEPRSAGSNSADMNLAGQLPAAFV